MSDTIYCTVEGRKKIRKKYVLNSIALYLRDIHNTAILTKKEEVGNLDDITNRNILIELNMGLGVSIANRYRCSSLETSDIIQIANIGLIKASQNYDTSRGIKFSSYAGRCIENEILREIKMLLNDTMSTDEILERETLSCEGILVDTSELVDNDAVINKSSMIENLKELVERCNLTKVEFMVLVMFFGLFNVEKITLEEIAKHPRIIKELNNDSFDRRRIHQIKNDAINKLRRSKSIEEFAVYMNNPDLALSRIDEYRKKLCGDNQEKYKRKVVLQYKR